MPSMKMIITEYRTIGWQIIVLNVFLDSCMVGFIPRQFHTAMCPEKQKQFHHTTYLVHRTKSEKTTLWKLISLKSETVTLVVQQSVDSYWIQGEQRKQFFTDSKWHSVPIMSPTQHKVKSVPYLWPLPELPGQAAAGKRCQWVPILYQVQERDSAAIRLTLSAAVQQAEGGKTALNWRQRLAQGSGWAANLVLKLEKEDIRLPMFLCCNLFHDSTSPENNLSSLFGTAACSRNSVSWEILFSENSTESSLLKDFHFGIYSFQSDAINISTYTATINRPYMLQSFTVNFN